MNYAYYPGCSLERNAAAYDVSARSVAAVLDLGLKEIDDWNCCGATEYISLHKLASYALIARNLALAQKQFVTPSDGMHGPDGRTHLIAPCSACFLNLRKADHYLEEDIYLRDQTNQALAAGGLHYDPGTIRVRHLLEVLFTDIGLDAVKSRVTKSLHPLRVAPYYGCLLSRPRVGGELADAEYPTELDELMQALGAQVVDFPLKTHCCGGHMTQISEGVAFELIRQLLKNAAEYNADVIVTLCPMCQLNLDAYQGMVNHRFGTKFKLPILYFTQLMGVAFGLDPKKLGFGKEVVSAQEAMARIGVEAPAPEETTPKRKPRKPKEALPMPQMPGREVKP